MESKDCKLELELSLSQLPNPPFQLLQPPIRDEAEPSRKRKKPRVEQLWYENLQDNAQALVILMQVGSVEPEGHDVTFHGYYQGSNLYYY
jgi:hypothetical protein